MITSDNEFFTAGYLAAMADLREICSAIDRDLRRSEDGMPEGYNHHQRASEWATEACFQFRDQRQ